jgi:hypothetical protein
VPGAETALGVVLADGSGRHEDGTQAGLVEVLERNREITEALFISRKTGDYHLGHVYEKLEVPREASARRWRQKTRWVTWCSAGAHLHTVRRWTPRRHASSSN